METRNKSLKGATGSGARDLEAVDEAEIRPARDPSPPVLSRRASPVHRDAEVITGQHQEPSSTSPRPGAPTLEIPVRIDPVESAVIHPVASGPLASRV